MQGWEVWPRREICRWGVIEMEKITIRIPMTFDDFLEI